MKTRRNSATIASGLQGLLWPDLAPAPPPAPPDVPTPSDLPVAPPAPPETSPTDPAPSVIPAEAGISPSGSASDRPSVPPQATRDAVDRLLAELTAERRIKPPRVEWSTRMRSLLGRAFVRRNLIRLSAWLDHDQALETLRHELAHIAVGPAKESPHGPKWRAWAVRLGANPRATSHRPPEHAPDRTANRRYTGLECPGCGLRFVRARVLSGLYCRACGPRNGMLAKRVHGPRPAVAEWAAAGRA